MAVARRLALASAASSVLDISFPDLVVRQVCLEDRASTSRCHPGFRASERPGPMIAARQKKWARRRSAFSRFPVFMGPGQALRAFRDDTEGCYARDARMQNVVSSAAAGSNVKPDVVASTVKPAASNSAAACACEY